MRHGSEWPENRRRPGEVELDFSGFKNLGVAARPVSNSERYVLFRFPQQQPASVRIVSSPDASGSLGLRLVHETRIPALFVLSVL